MIVEHLSSDALREVIRQLPAGWARNKYEIMLAQKAADEEPALYYLNEILQLATHGDIEVRDIHQAKLAYPGIRVLQDAAPDHAVKSGEGPRTYGRRQTCNKHESFPALVRR